MNSVIILRNKFDKNLLDVFFMDFTVSIKTVDQFVI